MHSVGLKVLRSKLSEYIRLVASGETVLITDGDRVVAELVPPSRGRGEITSDVSLADAVRRGWLTPPLIGPGGDVPRQPVLMFAALLDDLAADR
jgi:antitoxin (DNA-binding transcriptional repressor) of toxin-antitoxin stability system